MGKKLSFEEVVRSVIEIGKEQKCMIDAIRFLREHVSEEYIDCSCSYCVAGQHLRYPARYYSLGSFKWCKDLVEYLCR